MCVCVSIHKVLGFNNAFIILGHIETRKKPRSNRE